MLSYILPRLTQNTNKCVIGLYAGVTCCIHKLIGNTLCHPDTFIGRSGFTDHSFGPTAARVVRVSAWLKAVQRALYHIACNLRKYTANALHTIHFRMGRAQAYLKWPHTGHLHSPFKYGWASEQGSVSPRTRRWMDAPRGIAEKLLWGEIWQMDEVFFEEKPDLFGQLAWTCCMIGGQMSRLNPPPPSDSPEDEAPPTHPLQGSLLDS